MSRQEHPAKNPIKQRFGEVTGQNLECQSEEWLKTREDGRRVKFTNHELPDQVVFITAQIEGNEVVYSIMLTKAQNPLSRAEVEQRFAVELSKK